MNQYLLNSREMMYAAIEGRKLENYPVTAPYLMLSNADHWTELTGLPVWKFYEWALLEPGMHAEMYKVFYDRLPFDAVQPWFAPTREHRENTEVILKDGKAYYHYKKEDKYTKVPEVIHEAGSSGSAVEIRIVFERNDIKEKVIVKKAENIISDGCNDYIEGIIKLMGKDKFVINGGIVNTFYSCSWYVGFTNLFALLYEEPDLIKYLSERILEKNIEVIRAYAAAGGDAIYIDDATATCDMISPEFYEEFSLPYLAEQVKEIQHLGKKAIVIYFGGIADRVEQIVSTGADILSMETSMKAYTNDYEAIAKQVGGRMCLTGNLNPYDDIEITNDEDLYGKIKRQVYLGRKYSRYITSTGSPLTPKTTVSRMRRFIDIAHEV